MSRNCKLKLSIAHLLKKKKKKMNRFKIIDMESQNLISANLKPRNMEEEVMVIGAL